MALEENEENWKISWRKWRNEENCPVKGTSLLVLLRNIIARTCSFKYQEWHVDCHYCITQADTINDIMASV